MLVWIFGPISCLKYQERREGNMKIKESEIQRCALSCAYTLCCHHMIYLVCEFFASFYTSLLGIGYYPSKCHTYLFQVHDTPQIFWACLLYSRACRILQTLILDIFHHLNNFGYLYICYIVYKYHYWIIHNIIMRVAT